jgi:plasmid stabilization system protein ParE
MRVRFTPQAASDLDAIARFFEPEHASILPRILSDIEAKLDLIRQYPEAGQQQQDLSIRKAVTRRYRYISYYRLFKNRNELQIIAIRHFKQSRKYEDN